MAARARRWIRTACAVAAGGVALYHAAGYAAAWYLTRPRHAPVADPPGGRRLSFTTADGLRLAAWTNDVPGARATAVLAPMLCGAGAVTPGA
jgi:hypothetical protein